MENFRCVIVSIPRFRFFSSFEERTRFGENFGRIAYLLLEKKRERENRSWSCILLSLSSSCGRSHVSL